MKPFMMASAMGSVSARQRQDATAGRSRRTEMDGASGCYFVIDRKQDMFSQTPSERRKIQPMVKKLIHEALEK